MNTVPPRKRVRQGVNRLNTRRPQTNLLSMPPWRGGRDPDAKPAPNGVNRDIDVADSRECPLGNGEAKPAAFAQFALHPYSAAVGFNYTFGDPKAQARAA